jgi:excisionase family DNA binding protein
MRETSERLGVSLFTLRAWVKKRKIPYVQPTGKGGAIMFDPEELQKWIDAGRVKNHKGGIE